jgi:phosphoserine phosphatase
VAVTSGSTSRIAIFDLDRTLIRCDSFPALLNALLLQMLKEAGIVPPWSVVDTDSASDLPLLHLAERRCVVNATPAALRTLNRELGAETLEIIQWK